MKKIVTIALTLIIIMSMAIPAHALTPKLEIPDIPDFSNIKFTPKIELPDDFWSNWFKEHPLKIDLSGIKLGG